MSIDALPSTREDSTPTPEFDSTQVLAAIDDETAVIPAVSTPPGFYEPIPALLPVPEDDGDGADAELVIYHCGTTAPGHVHDPCQHSAVQVLCCTCAGCMFDLWSCRQDQLEPQWWEANSLASTADPLLRHQYAMVVYALMIIFALASGVIPAFVQLIFQMIYAVMIIAAFAVSTIVF